MKVHLKVLLVDVGRHGDDWRVGLHFTDHGSCRHAVKLGHDYIHEY